MDLPYTYSPYIWPSIIASFLLIGLVVFSFRYRDMPGALPFTIACGLGLFWSIGSIFLSPAADITSDIFWHKFLVLFQLPSAKAITCFLLENTWPKRWLTRRNLALLSIAPLLVFLLIITDPVQHLFWAGFEYNGGLEALPDPMMKYFITL